MDSLIEKLVDSSIRAVGTLKTAESLRFLQEASDLLAQTFRNNGKVIAIGNGGSLCDASHFAEELTGFFRNKRPALPAIAITDPGHITCVANDIGYDWVFARAIAAHGLPGDVLVALTTSGRSPSIIKAVEEAHQRGLKTIAFLGKGGGPLRGKADLELHIDYFETSDRIQEAHMAALHIIIDLVELRLFPELSNPYAATAAYN